MMQTSTWTLSYQTLQPHSIRNARGHVTHGCYCNVPESKQYSSLQWIPSNTKTSHVCMHMHVMPTTHQVAGAGVVG